MLKLLSTYLSWDIEYFPKKVLKINNFKGLSKQTISAISGLEIRRKRVASTPIFVMQKRENQRFIFEVRY